MAVNFSFVHGKILITVIAIVALLFCSESGSSEMATSGSVVPYKIRLLIAVIVVTHLSSTGDDASWESLGSICALTLDSSLLSTD
uniref:Uncharacterized protein n=2 Tax=Setaria viridis TaxID=4556 RepID=A0A4U6TLM1_SETVI|nr:hypothetical protein SEVIR_8G225500v2 [Setaria viridis]